MGGFRSKVFIDYFEDYDTYFILFKAVFSGVNKSSCRANFHDAAVAATANTTAAMTMNFRAEKLKLSKIDRVFLKFKAETILFELEALNLQGYRCKMTFMHEENIGHERPI
uniref:Uncharacterized protein n=1 Tax=Trichogramma kaykai TaxID=54128 RepID=A0ABD2WWD7_9HYME